MIIKVGFSDGRAATALMGAVTVIAYAFTPLLVSCSRVEELGIMQQRS